MGQLNLYTEMKKFYCNVYIPTVVCTCSIIDLIYGSMKDMVKMAIFPGGVIQTWHKQKGYVYH